MNIGLNDVSTISYLKCMHFTSCYAKFCNLIQWLCTAPPLQALRFNDLKWERPLSLLDDDYSTIHLSSNAVEYGGEIFFGVSSTDAAIYKITADPKKASGHRFSEAEYITGIDRSLQDYALVVCQGLLHMLGGEYVRNDQPTGKYSRNVFTLRSKINNKLMKCYPPMKTASASPAVVNYKECIVVVHKSGAVEVLNTNSPSLAWAEVHPALYFPTTPSATLLGDLLVIWSGTLYYNDLRDVFTDDIEDSNPTADWTTLPSPHIPSSSARLTTFNDQLIAIGIGNTDGSRPLYAFNGATGKWSHVDNQCPGDVTVCLDSKTLLTLCMGGYDLCVCEGVLA